MMSMDVAIRSAPRVFESLLKSYSDVEMIDLIEANIERYVHSDKGQYFMWIKILQRFNAHLDSKGLVCLKYPNRIRVKDEVFPPVKPKVRTAEIGYEWDFRSNNLEEED